MRSTSENDFYTRLGTAIRRRRRLCDMTQEQLADRAGTYFQQISNYESGRCRVPVYLLHNIAITLGTSVGAFIDAATPGTLGCVLTEQSAQ